EAHPPAMSENRNPRVYYATQVGTNPPTIVLFVNSTRLFDPTYQRYLLNVFREKLPFHDIPIKLYMRARKQTEPGARGAANGDHGEFDEQEFESHPTAHSGSSSNPGLEGFRFLDREVNELLSDLDG
ncbi:MAG: ribosome biogenesis GTPase Der, partial [Isosphaeraceae bacterium]